MKQKDQQYDAIFTTDVAVIGLILEGSRLTNIDYLKQKTGKPATKPATGKVAETVKNKIEKYLSPQSKTKSVKVEIKLNVTPFQEKVLRQLQKIPYGETKTYGDIAKILNTSPRAIGNACRNNPLPIIIPCHRVVAANSIGGYDGAKSGKLLKIKRKLLANEGVYY